MRNLRFFPERVTKAGHARLSAAADRARGIVSRQPPPSPNVVRHDRLDVVMLDAQRAKWPRYQQLVEQGSRHSEHFDDLLTDLFFGLYFYEPQLRQRRQVLPSHRANWDLYMQAQRLSLWEEARISATLNPKHAIISLVYVAQALIDALDDVDEESKEQAEQATQDGDAERETLTHQIQDLIDQIEQAMEQGPAPDDPPTPAQQPSTNLFARRAIKATAEDGTGAAEAQPDPDEQAALQAIEQEIEEIERQLADAYGDGEEDSGINPSLARAAARRGAEAAANALDELDEMLACWGSDAGEFEAMDPGKAFALYDRIGSLPSVRQFTIELGRMRNAGLDAQMQSNAREPQEIVDVTTGRSWSDALPSERLLLGDPRTAPLFWARMVQEGLLTWAYAGREPARKGPFIMLVDVSGSTAGTRERWGKAFTLAALDIARRDSRDCGVVFFDGEVNPAGVFTFPGGKASLDDKISLAAYYTGGGTDWRAPLALALSNIEASDGTWQRADVVMVTDGQCGLDDDFIADYRRRCAAKGIRTHGVLLDGNPRWAESMKPFCDRVFTIDSLTGSDAAKPIFDLLAN